MTTCKKEPTNGECQLPSECSRERSLIDTVDQVTSALMSAAEEDLRHSLEKSLSHLCRGIGVDEASLWRNGEDAYGRACCRKFLSAGTGTSARSSGEAETIIYDQSLPGWLGTLSSGQNVNAVTGSLDEPHRSMFVPSVKSVLIIPIFFGDSFRGYLRLDDRLRERLFDACDEKVSRTCAMSIASAVARCEMADDLMQARTASMHMLHKKSVLLTDMGRKMSIPAKAISEMAEHARKCVNELDRLLGCLREIETAAAHLHALSRNAVDLSEIESGELRIELRPFSFWDMSRNVYISNIDRVEKHGRSLLFEIDETIPRMLLGDERRIAQIVNHMITGALTSSSQAAPVVLKADEAGREGSRSKILITVSYRGPRLLATDDWQTFGLFTEENTDIAGDSEATAELAICGELALMMGGSLTVQSGEDGHNTFALSIALEKQPESQARRMPDGLRRRYDFSGKRFLLAEDAETNREIVASLLAPTGAAVDIARNGLEACEKYAGSPESYDLILMDLDMPILNGCQAARLIRNHRTAGARRIPILAMTTQAFPEDVHQCKKAGMDDHIAKPIEMETLLGKISAHLDGKRNQKET